MSAIGPDGAAYFTNSNAPQIFRVAPSGDGYAAELWVDASGTIAIETGFNLGGIVTSPDRSALIVAQGNVGRLWRFDLADRSATPIDTGATELKDADGLVLRGTKLTVVRNFSQVVTTLRVAADGTSATLVSERSTDPTRVLTTAKFLRGRILYVDSKFDETVAAPPYEVVTNPFVARHDRRQGEVAAARVWLPAFPKVSLVRMVDRTRRGEAHGRVPARGGGGRPRPRPASPVRGRAGLPAPVALRPGHHAQHPSAGSGVRRVQRLAAWEAKAQRDEDAATLAALERIEFQDPRLDA